MKLGWVSFSFPVLPSVIATSPPHHTLHTAVFHGGNDLGPLGQGKAGHTENTPHKASWVTRDAEGTGQ